jgi:crescentin
MRSASERARRRPLLKRETYRPRTLSAEFDRDEQPPRIELANEVERPGTTPAQLKQLATREPTDACIENALIEPAAAERMVAADKRVAELEEELGAAREELAIRENENHSLQTSLGLIVSEHLRLFHLLTENDLAVGKARYQVQQKRTALTVAQAKYNALAAQVSGASEKRPIKTNMANTHLEAMSSRAVAEVTFLLSLLACAEANRADKQKVEDVTPIRNPSGETLEVLQNTIHVKDRQIQGLEQSCRTLIEGASTLLRTSETRDTALARVENTINSLVERVTRLEAEPSLDGNHTPTNSTDLLRELADYVRRISRYSESTQGGVTAKLLDSTITL